MMELWPFTNFHDLNMDWIIKTIKTYTEKVDSFFKTDVYRYLEKVLAAHPEWMQPVNDVQVWARPEAYGAYGDGIVDDTAAVQEAMDTGLPVLLKNTYRVTKTLEYTGPVIDGRGKLVADDPLEHVLEITTPGSYSCNNINIDCNNKAAMGIYSLYAGHGAAVFEGVTVENTDNALIGHVNCSGIYVTGYDTVTVRNCKIKNINRTNAQQYALSSTGIRVKSKIMDVSDNYIETVTCSASTIDSDGVFVGSPDETETRAVVENNTIIDSTGRFVKSQASRTIIKNNDCYLTQNVPGNLFFKCFDLQSGDGEVRENVCNLGNKLATSSHLVQRGGGTDDNVSIRNNTFTNVTAGVRAFYFSDIMYTGQVDIVSNIVDARLEYLVETVEPNAPTSFTLTDNKIPVFRVFKCSGINMENITLYLERNTSTYTNNRVFADDGAKINNIVIRDNTGIVDTLNNIVFDYAQMKVGELYYSSANPCLNPPAALTDATRFWLKKCTYSGICQYYEYTHGHSGYIAP